MPVLAKAENFMNLDANKPKYLEDINHNSKKENSNLKKIGFEFDPLHSKNENISVTHQSRNFENVIIKDEPNMSPSEANNDWNMQQTNEEIGNENENELGFNEGLDDFNNQMNFQGEMEEAKFSESSRGKPQLLDKNGQLYNKNYESPKIGKYGQRIWWVCREYKRQQNVGSQKKCPARAITEGKYVVQWGMEGRFEHNH